MPVIPGIYFNSRPHECQSQSKLRGPIGAGKSAILHVVQACTEYDNDVHVFLEDTKEWQYYLEKNYNNPAEYVSMFQKEVGMHFFRMTKRLEQLEDNSGDRDVIAYVDRAPSDVARVPPP